MSDTNLYNRYIAEAESALKKAQGELVSAQSYVNARANRADAEPKYKVGMNVYVKYDVEQSAKILEVKQDYLGIKYKVKLSQGGHEQPRGTTVWFKEDEIF